MNTAPARAEAVRVHQIPGRPVKRGVRNVRVFNAVRHFIIRVPHGSVVRPRRSLSGSSRQPRLKRGGAMRRSPGSESAQSGGEQSEDGHSQPHSFVSNKIGTASHEQIEVAEQRNESQRLNSAVKRTDTYGHLVDINLHRWIVWLVNRSQLLPHFYLPSIQHFTFGSVHDVSNRIHMVEDQCSLNAGGRSRAHWVYSFWRYTVDKNCSYAPAIEAAEAQPVENISMQARRISQTKTIMPGQFDANANERPTSSASKASETSETNKTANGSLASSSSDYKAAALAVATNGAPASPIKSICSLKEKPEFSSVAGDLEAALAQENVVPLGEANATAAEEERDVQTATAYSQAAFFSARAWFSCRSIFAMAFFLLVLSRYILHLWIVMFSETRSVRYIWCPLLIDTLTVIGTCITVIWLICTKFAIEDLIIGTSSFLTPLTRSHQSLIRWLPRAYFAIQLLFLAANLLGTVSVVLQNFELALFEPNSTLLTDLQLPSSRAATPMSHWHLYETYWLTGIREGEICNGTCTNETTVDSFEHSIMRWPWIFWPDLALRSYINLVMVLAKTFYLSIALIIIVKCWQLCWERLYCLGETFNQTTQNRVKEPVPHVSIGRRPCRGRDSNSSEHAPSPVMQMNQENERFCILAQMQMENIRTFDGIFLVLVLLWVVLCITRMVGLLEYVFCHKVKLDPYEKVVEMPSPEPTLASWWREFNIDVPEVPPRSPPSAVEIIYRWYELSFLCFYSFLQGLDIVVPLVVIVFTTYYRARMAR